jgi:CrcB protein
MVALGVGRLAGPGLPVATLAVNVVGCFVMGLAWAWLAERGGARAAPLLVAGFLGGFTTFSAFAADAFALWDRGAAGAAAAYVAASVGLSLAALAAGAFAMRGMLA